jgi:hypothetical protein
MSDRLTEMDIAYTAGLIDGAGFINIGRKVKSPTLTVGVRSRTKAVLLVLRSWHRGAIWRTDDGEQWQWRAFGRHAEDLLRLVQPFLVTRAEQCSLALAVRERLHTGDALSRGRADSRNPRRDVGVSVFRDYAESRVADLNKEDN